MTYPLRSRALRIAAALVLLLLGAIGVVGSVLSSSTSVAFAAPPAQAVQCPAGTDLEAGSAPRRLAFELEFGAGSPYAQRYGDAFGDLDYLSKAAVTTEVLDHVVEVALRVVGASAVARGYGPGGYERIVSPSGQLDVCASPTTAEQIMMVIGYLAQQTEVYGSQPTPNGPNSAIDIYQTNGTQLRDHAIAAELFQRLGALDDRLFTGFQPLEFRDSSGATRVGIRIINTDGVWADDELRAFGPSISKAVEAVNQALGRQLIVDWQDLRVKLAAVGNDWKESPDGSGYLQGLSAAGRSAVSRALVDLHAPEVERRIRAALVRYTGGRAPAQLR